MSFNTEAYLGIFLDELDEQLQVLDEMLLKLEQDGDDMETIGAIFRAAHTLKGSSAAMGFDRMKELTHQIENVFELIRNRQLAVDSSLITLLFQGIDYIKVLKQAIVEGQPEEADIGPLVESLDGIRRRALGEPGETESKATPKNEAHDVWEQVVKFHEHEKKAIVHALQSGFQVMTLYVRITPDAVMKSVRALLVYTKVKESGEVIAVSPPTETIEDEQAFQGTLLLTLITEEDKRSLAETLNHISHIDSYHITMITPDNLDSFCGGTEAASADAYTSEEAAPAAPVSARTEPDAKIKVNPTVRVDVDRLENLLNYVGELIIDNTRLIEVKNRLSRQFKENPDVAVLHDICNHLSRVVGELQDGMMKTRMLPIEQLFNRFPRMVRDLAHHIGKEIDFAIEGKETELDRTLIEEISDPLIHILRNAVDHGLESPEERVKAGKPAKGRLLLKAAHQENQIVISIRDDGRGIDPLKIKQSSIAKGFVTEEEASRMTDKELMFLIFKSGVSTAERVTDLSGRGVGMDIVRAHIEKLNGLIDIDSSPGVGTVFTIKLPLTLAIIRSLLIKLGASTFALPLVNVIEIVRLSAEDIETVQGQEVCVIRGIVFPLVRLHRRFRIPQDDTPRRLLVVVVGLAEKRVCLVVDETVGNQEIVIKSLGPFVGEVPYIAGSTILGNGNVALILDVGSLIKEEGSLLLTKQSEMQKKDAVQSGESQYVAFKLAGEQYGLDIRKVKEIIAIPPVTRMVNAPSELLGIINLRGTVLPVYDLRQCLRLPEEKTTATSRVIVMEAEGRDVGIVIDEVTEVLRVRDAGIKAAGSVMRIDDRYLRGIYQQDDRFFILLDMDRLLEGAAVGEAVQL
ncbi:chemotaxis protein CheW [Paenibacillus sp. MZ04-78.2]|uniref:chemotaxis protein CheW n=1 Tax=Paenibacillus sp. MZ04-78.2 TaxID=2962034 RepID=UPI0020B8E6D3|nr:chemotaxis protein CheW [Paenibacillus sp. MZ04-78.2]MCP3774886.1 chemotaxis protein CheW [Paenibacillus sp. MZ04-78.2]